MRDGVDEIGSVTALLGGRVFVLGWFDLGLELIGWECLCDEGLGMCFLFEVVVWL